MSCNENKKRIFFSKEIKQKIISKFLTGKKLKEIFKEFELEKEIFKSKDKKYLVKLFNSWIQNLKLNKDRIMKLNRILNKQEFNKANNKVDEVQGIILETKDF